MIRFKVQFAGPGRASTRGRVTMIRVGISPTRATMIDTVNRCNRDESREDVDMKWQNE